MEASNYNYNPISRLNLKDTLEHGHNRKGKRTGTYRSWLRMRERCGDPHNNRYQYYGLRGITVCSRWVSSFSNFLEDMGVRPEGTTLDRIDVEGNYEPGNCRWADVVTQRHNRRGVKK